MKRKIKKLFCLLLVIAMAISLVPAMAQPASAAATQTATPDDILSMCNPVGRLTKYNDTVLMESSAANFTLCGQLQGDIRMDVTVEAFTTEYHNLFVEVDGTMYYFELEVGRQTVTLVKNLDAGYHTIRISKGPEAKKEVYYIHGVEYTGQLEKAEAATRRIEFLGDSITAGTGVYFYDAGFGGTHSYFSYANMTADAFGADYYSVANGGWKFSQSLYPADSIGTIYEKVSMHKELGTYDFAWQPDVIVINLGTNDAIVGRKTDKFTAETYMTDVELLLDMVRRNNPDAQIFWVYGMLIKEREDWLQAAVEAYMQKDEKVQYLHLNGNTAGRGDHPDIDGQIKGANMLIQAISETMGWDVDPAKDPTVIRNQEKIATAARIQKEALTLDFSQNYCPVCGEISGWTKLGGKNRAFPGTTVGNAPHFTASENQHFYWDPADYPNGVVSSTTYNWLQVGAKVNVCVNLSGLQHNYTGRIHWGGAGTLNIMGAGSLNAAGKSNASNNLGNLYTNAAGTINLYGGTYTYAEAVTLNKPASNTDARHATLSVHNANATINIYEGVVLENNVGANVAGDIGTVNMYGGILRNGKGYPYHADQITASTTDWERCGGNVYLYGQSATKQVTFNMYGGKITGGTAARGGNVFVYKNAAFNLYGGSVTNGAATTGNNIYLANTAKLKVDGNWVGSATVAFEKNYTYGDPIADTTTVGDFTGSLRYEGSAAQPNIFADGGQLVIAPVRIRLAGSSDLWAKNNTDAVAKQQANAGSYISALLPGTTFDLPAGKTVTIDFNGMAATVTGDGTLRGVDQRNDTFLAENCGQVTVADTVTVETAVTGGENGYCYIAVKDGSYSFHRLALTIDAVTLRASAAGLYYQASSTCDPVLATQVAAYGVQLSVNEDMSNAAYTRLEGAPAVGAPFTSGSVFGIFKNGRNNNTARGEQKIYAAAYLQLQDGTTVLGSNLEGWSLRDVLTALDGSYADLSGEDKATFDAFCDTWAEAIAPWQLSNG